VEDEQPEWKDEDDRKDAAEDRKHRRAGAAAERRQVWVASVVAMLHSGRHPKEATIGAETVLDEFDTTFPGILKCAAGLDADDEGDE